MVLFLLSFSPSSHFPSIRHCPSPSCLFFGVRSTSQVSKSSLNIIFLLLFWSHHHGNWCGMINQRSLFFFFSEDHVLNLLAWPPGLISDLEDIWVHEAWRVSGCRQLFTCSHTFGMMTSIGSARVGVLGLETHTVREAKDLGRRHSK